jgi:maleylacetate reductase
MRPFVYEAMATRVVFGVGSLESTAGEVSRLGSARVMLVADPQVKDVAERIAAQLGDALVSNWGEVVQHVPVELAERARAQAAERGVDAIVCCGGGSSTGLAKAIALTSGVPIVAVPTTYAGSEMTPIYGLTGRHKQTGRSLSVVPKAVIYDPALTTRLPPSVTGASGFNALAHCIEALYGPGANPVTSIVALEGIRAVGRSLERAVAEGGDLDARSDLLYGAWLSGIALGQTGTALHHKVCHALGGTYDLVHADVNVVVLPHAVAYNTPGVPSEMADVATALGHDGDAASALHELAVAIGAPTSLEAIGMPYDGLDEAAERTAAESMVNPVPVTRAAVREMLERAWTGSPPRFT